MNNIKIGQVVNHKSFGDAFVTAVDKNVGLVTCFFFKTKNEKKIIESFLDKPQKVYTIKELFLTGAPYYLFDSKTKNKAIGYAKQELISNINLEDTYVSADIVGSILYHVRYSLNDNVLTMSCTCPVEGKCKHLAALALYLYRVLNGNIESSRIDDFMENNGLYDRELAFEKESDYEKIDVESLADVFNKLNEVINENNSLDFDAIKHYMDYEDPINLFKRAIASNEKVYSILKYNIDEIGENRFKLIEQFRIEKPNTYIERSRGRFDSLTANEVMLYELFNKSYQQLTDALSFVKRTNIWKAIMLFLGGVLYTHFRKSEFLDLIRHDYKFLREIYEGIMDQALKNPFYICFEKELTSVGVINTSITTKDRLSSIFSLNNRSEIIRELKAVVPLAIKEGEYDYVVELILKLISKTGNILTFQERHTLVNLINGYEDSDFISKLILGEEIYE